jgi:hypothetical protein
VKVTIELSESMVELLAVLGEGGKPEAALLELAARAVDGVSRPGSWERQWLHQAFGDAWEERLEPDPHAHWRQCPRRRARRTRRGSVDR